MRPHEFIGRLAQSQTCMRPRSNDDSSMARIVSPDTVFTGGLFTQPKFLCWSSPGSSAKAVAREELEGVVGVVQLREEDEIVALVLVVDDARRALFGGVGGEGRLEELMLQEAPFSLLCLLMLSSTRMLLLCSTDGLRVVEEMSVASPQSLR